MPIEAYRVLAVPRFLGDAFAAIAKERENQIKTWGDVTYPDGTGGEDAIEARNYAQKLCNDAAVNDHLTFRHVLSEETLEVFAETDPRALRAELVQVGAVTAHWIEDLDRRIAQSEAPDQVALTAVAA